jgi:MoxR-like ATPase
MTKNEEHQLRLRRHEEITRIDAAVPKDGKTPAAPIKLDKQGSWPKTWYLLERPVADALIAALASGKPLLVRGEPGIGKSQLARAAAAVLDRPFIFEVVQPDSEYTDLLWRIDHTKRLADAQMAGRRPAEVEGEKEKATVRDVDNIAHYIGPGPIWWAFNAETAQRQHQEGAPNFLPDPPVEPSQCKCSGVVLLIDEVDKADISLTNGLLEVLGNGGFSVPSLGESVSAVGPPPLVVLTSNNTRELPPALLRRCIVLSLSLHKDVKGHLERIGRTVFPETDFPELGDQLLSEAAAQIVEDRKRCTDLPRTGLAEYLDLLRALGELTENGGDAQEWLGRLGRYFQKSQINRD